VKVFPRRIYIFFFIVQSCFFYHHRLMLCLTFPRFSCMPLKIAPIFHQRFLKVILSSIAPQKFYDLSQFFVTFIFYRSYFFFNVVYGICIYLACAIMLEKLIKTSLRCLDRELFSIAETNLQICISTPRNCLILRKRHDGFKRKEEQ